MRPIDIENWALKVIERVISRQPVEDFRVELKSEWPEDPHRAARQIAGHANAARGEPILWLIGIDEKKAMVTGAGYEEISNWKQSIEAKFDELSPVLTHLNVPYEDKTVVALFWETDRRPFLVKTPGGGQVTLEVPWRDACSTRTATRMDLLRLLYPVSKAPAFELIDGHLQISTGERDEYNRPYPPGRLSIDVYIVSGSSERIVIPYHKCEANLRFLSTELCLAPKHVWFHSSYSYPGISIFETRPPSSTVICTGTEAVIDGPGMATIITSDLPVSSEQMNLIHGDIEMKIKMLPIGTDMPISIVGRLSQVEAPKGTLGRWVISPFDKR
ncbi:MAG: hypothetical protein ABIF19_14805 [Planctomycetota bacterium]